LDDSEAEESPTIWLRGRMRLYNEPLNVTISVGSAHTSSCNQTTLEPEKLNTVFRFANVITTS